MDVVMGGAAKNKQASLFGDYFSEASSREASESDMAWTSGHPVSSVRWVPVDSVVGNDYNPNVVAPTEMKLLQTSIEADGFTQPIVVWENEPGRYQVVDGFHRHLVGRKLGLSHLPVVVINDDRSEKSDRIASTIRHNRARGKHQISAMSDIVVELKNRNWANERISRELGMDEDEILRLCQITGLADMFKDQEFSKAWDVDGELTEADIAELTDDVDEYGDEIKEFRTVNTSDEDRIFHTYDKWECHKAGFYQPTKEGMSKSECESAYAEFLSDLDAFGAALESVITEWKHSCEHYLTNRAMNRIAWLGQAAACYAIGLPSAYRGGYNLLSDDQKIAADNLALQYLNEWMSRNGRQPVDVDQAAPDRQSEVY